MARRCQYCGENLGLLKLFKGAIFCSEEHETLYASEQSTRAFQRLQSSHFSATPVEPAVSEKPAETPETPAVDVQQASQPPVLDVPQALLPPSFSSREDPLPVRPFLATRIEPAEDSLRPLLPVDPDTGLVSSIALTQGTQRSELSIPLGPVIVLESNARRLESPSPGAAEREPMGFLADWVFVRQTKLSLPQSELRPAFAYLDAAQENAASQDENLERLSVQGLRIMNVAAGGVAPQEPIGPSIPSPRISPLESGARVAWRPGATISFVPSPRAAAEPAAFEALAAFPDGTARLRRPGELRGTNLPDFGRMPRFAWDHPAFRPMPVPASISSAPEVETWTGRSIRPLPTVIQTTRLEIGTVADPFFAASARDAIPRTFPSAGHMETFTKPAINPPVASPAPALRPAAANAYRTIGIEPSQKDVTSGFLLSNWMDEGARTAIPHLRLVSCGRRIGAAGLAVAGNVSMDRDPLRIAKRDARETESLLFAGAGAWIGGYALAFRYADRTGSGRLLQAALRLRPVAANSYRAAGIDPPQGEIPRRFLPSGWMDGGVRTAIPHLGLLSGERRIRAAGLAVAGNASMDRDPLRIASRAAQEPESILFAGSGTWIDDCAHASRQADGPALRRLAHVVCAAPRIAGRSSSLFGASARDVETTFRSAPQYALIRVAPPQKSRLASNVFAILERAEARVRSSLHAYRSEIPVSFEPQAGPWELPPRAPEAGLPASIRLARITPLERFHPLNRFVSLVVPKLNLRLARRNDIAFPHFSASGAATLVVGCSRELLTPSDGADLHAPWQAQALPPSPASLSTMLVCSDQITAAPIVCSQIEMLEMRPLRGKLHLGVTARLERETASPCLADGILIHPAAPAVHPAAGTVNLLVGRRAGRNESRIEPASTFRVPASSMLASPLSPGLQRCDMPPPGSRSFPVFPTSTRNVQIAQPQPEPSAGSNQLSLRSPVPGQRMGKSAVGELTPLSLRTATPLPEHLLEAPNFGVSSRSSRTSTVLIGADAPCFWPFLAERQGIGLSSDGAGNSGIEGLDDRTQKLLLFRNLAEPCPARSSQYWTLGLLPVRSAIAEGCGRRQCMRLPKSAWYKETRPVADKSCSPC